MSLFKRPCDRKLRSKKTRGRKKESGEKSESEKRRRSFAAEDFEVQGAVAAVVEAAGRDIVGHRAMFFATLFCAEIPTREIIIWVKFDKLTHVVIYERMLEC
ncbi:hypothetical protein Nepgr_015203 [Nepenthes gracilis]|uniref:Uncharacterized protein n=1 Tax=Nepenthes gracilis TaxID=150966 RepID=A0AAD3XQ76_NEPGR|nr:hypothetical protein Nepgr_015203 [Nepenthes gracilis]